MVFCYRSLNAQGYEYKNHSTDGGFHLEFFFFSGLDKLKI